MITLTTNLASYENGLSNKLLSEWHPIKNIGIDPNELTYGSYEYLWWLCAEGHEWGATPAERLKKNEECPECLKKNRAQKKTTEKENKTSKTLREVDSELAKQWHPTKNGDITPDNVPFDEKWTSYWWQCKRGHSWEESIKRRHDHKTVCGYCSDKLVNEENCLANRYPDLAKEWFVFENTNLGDIITPYDVVYNSKEIVHWLCEQGHIWEERISKRIKNDIECPKCLKLKKSLAVLNPKLAQEWHPTKNNHSFSSKRPEDVAANSSEYAWWLCPTCNNEYQARVSQRNKGEERCKTCHPPTSKPKNSIKSSKKGTYNTVRDIEDQRIIFENNLRDNLNKK